MLLVLTGFKNEECSCIFPFLGRFIYIRSLRDVYIYFLFRANALRTRKVDVYFLSRGDALSRANAPRTRKVDVYFLSRVPLFLAQTLQE